MQRVAARKVAAEQGGKLLCIGGSIVFPGDEGVFDRHAPPGGVKIVLGGGEQLVNAPFAVDRHQRRTARVVCRMERDRERDGEVFFFQLVDLRDDAGGGHRDVPSADVQPVRRGDEVQEFHGIFVVVKRLADAHHHDAVDALAKVAGCGGELAEHLGRRKVAHLAADGGGAEAAAHAAADLRGNAGGGAVLVEHDDGLDAFAVVEAEEVLHRAVHLGDQLALDFRNAARAGLDKTRAQDGGEVGHAVKVHAAPQPVGNLRRTEAALAHGADVVLQLGAGHGAKVGFGEGVRHVSLLFFAACR